MEVTAYVTLPIVGIAMIGAYLFRRSRRPIAKKLVRAVTTGRIRPLKALIRDGAHVDTRLEKGATPLIVAAGAGQGRVVEFLLDQGADPDVVSHWGTALTCAFSMGYPHVVDVLLSRGADIDVARPDGTTLLMMAVGRGDIGLVRSLLARRVDVFTPPGTAGPLCLTGSDERIAKLLEQHCEELVRGSNNDRASSREGPEAYYRRGIASFALNRQDQAIADLTKAIELEPGNLKAYQARASSHYYSREYGKAIEDLTEALSVDPMVAWAYNSRGLAYSNEGLYRQSVEDFTKFLEMNPMDGARARHNRGIAYLNLSDYDDAIADFSTCIENEEDLATDYYELCCVYSLQGDNGNALKYLEAAFANGFSKFDLIAQDQDLDSIRGTGDLNALIEKYGAGRDPRPQVSSQAYDLILDAMQTYTQAAGNPGALEELFATLDPHADDVASAVGLIAKKIEAGGLHVALPKTFNTLTSQLLELYRPNTRSAEETAPIVRECHALVSKYVSTSGSLPRAIDSVAAQIMPKYRLSRPEFMAIIKKAVSG